MKSIQSLFISHTSTDKEDYVLPLAEALTLRKVTFWLDANEVGWGDSVALKINQALRDTHYVLLCLSKNFLQRPWPEAEMNAALTMQNNKGIKKVLPLILNSKKAVLKTYPIIAGLAYREIRAGVDHIADELASLVGKKESNEGKVRIVIESVNTGQLSNLLLSPRASIGWLAERARICAGLRYSINVGRGIPLEFHIRWVLVDSEAEKNGEQ